ncbi:hypothetical protein LX32DRAFT_649871 [Colletotrichum zoysiae]|uniref:Uncharacterized protein n=1 Tax=Colletotrichum zoysiae TaxID=1216348 RepID=A0AAD9HQU9_9PEZI|nr:hypothetical protein LX32DRAFT_649871 [Colletotrichum zoysiae]
MESALPACLPVLSSCPTCTQVMYSTSYELSSSSSSSAAHLAGVPPILSAPRVGRGIGSPDHVPYLGIRTYGIRTQGQTGGGGGAPNQSLPLNPTTYFAPAWYLVKTLFTPSPPVCMDIRKYG